MSKVKPNDLFLFEGISYMVFNKDFTQVALSKKDNIIYIYLVKDIIRTSTWKLLNKLEAHSHYISGLDWNSYTNKILSCSYDKTSLVWKKDDNKWIPSNVVSQTKLGYLCCKWNYRGDKFCEGTSDNNLFIGYYNTENNWWTVKNIKIHKSSVLCCEIDPTSLFVISGSTDLTIYISSCYLPFIDDIHLTEHTKSLVQEFGVTLYEFHTNCWINSVTWTLSGKFGLAAGQDSTIEVIDYKNKKTDVINCKHSPVTFILANGDNSFYAVCYDRNILEYEKKENQWKVKKTITDESGIKLAEKLSKGRDLSDVIKICRSYHKVEVKSLATKKNPHLHKSIISSVNIRNKILITSDFAGFVKCWNI